MTFDMHHIIQSPEAPQVTADPFSIRSEAETVIEYPFPNTVTKRCHESVLCMLVQLAWQANGVVNSPHFSVLHLIIGTLGYNDAYTQMCRPFNSFSVVVST